jgi:hypothetical protein
VLLFWPFSLLFIYLFIVCIFFFICSESVMMEVLPGGATRNKESRVVYITRHGMRLDWVKPDWHLEKGWPRTRIFLQRES